ncbi:hypothetical protein EHS13_29900 [Paenibacillus psychroresistens]|uniref:Uncharacterized protein n=1 Tax=Paenibacillus psychroresistens TaxID=1778678 RepID=A0A6B8RQY1_9BACL|nr:hypothetical protein [Paenibacillus psychroresistens]QGQ98790.1 hypothetical protein EHS13_29900 [Paenibacillus psychroresistens]
MNEWPAAIWAGISAMTAALVLSFIVVLGHLASDSARIQQDDDNAVAIVKELRKYSQFNETTGLHAQDVISAIAEARGTPEIWVDTDIGVSTTFNTNWKWVSSTPPAKFGTAYLTSIFPITAIYDGHLTKDANGAITQIEFRRQ